MKRLAWLGLAFLAATAGAEPKVTADFTYATAYIFRGLALSHRTFQPALTIENGNWSAGVFSDLPTVKGEQHEFDPWLYYSWEEDGLSWEAGLETYFYPEARDTDLRYSYELALGASQAVTWLPNFPLQAAAHVYYDLRLETFSTEGSLEHSTETKLAGRPLTLNWGVFAGYVDARNITPDDPAEKYRDSYKYYGAKLEAVLQLSERATLKAAVQRDNAPDADPGQGGTNNLSGIFTLNVAW